MLLAPDHLANNVSRETLLTLERYVTLLCKWTRAINLVGKSTESEVWDRHIVDSLQLVPLIPSVDTLADLGSGGGLPGLVIAIAKPDLQCTLIEQDQRKAAFLQECVAQLALANTRVLNAEITSVHETFDIITARALAPLADLFALAYPRMGKGATCLFPKGRNFAMEIEQATERWTFTCQRIPSTTDEKAAIIQIGGLSPTQGTL